MDSDKEIHTAIGFKRNNEYNDWLTFNENNDILRKILLGVSGYRKVEKDARDVSTRCSYAFLKIFASRGTRSSSKHNYDPGLCTVLL